ncbi:5883_t:CDS:2 [Paraglomus brasilianum]|uniref:5883_t:CDS:1 n=1 Tax=Paraglomus brasilianum TaxID=144538 RepID=A0A9N8Z7B4_9GLOM|nr:5883_t:CDS:2 [Paraglomus brasilianum]
MQPRIKAARLSSTISESKWATLSKADRLPAESVLGGIGGGVMCRHMINEISSLTAFTNIDSSPKSGQQFSDISFCHGKVIVLANS